MAPAAETVNAASQTAAEPILTTFDAVWQAADQVPNRRHRVRFDFVVYYYDPLWEAMWGRCGEADSYLSLGSREFPIRPGQRVLIEGFMVPGRGMLIEEPRVTVLADSVPLEPLSTTGEIGNIERFNKRLVTIEGFVDRQESRDVNHLNVTLIAAGRPVTAQVLLKGDAAPPTLRGAYVRAKGVYFARVESSGSAPKLELWVQGLHDLELLGSIDRDERFSLPVTKIAQLGEADRSQWVHVSGTVRAQQPGVSLTIRDETGEITVANQQTRSLEFGDAVEAIGLPAVDRDRPTLRQAMFRPAQRVLTRVAEIWTVPDSSRDEVHRVRFELDVHYYDPGWKVLWARDGDAGEYLTVGPLKVPVQPGQRILLEGLTVPARPMIIDQPRAQILGDAPRIEPLSTEGQIRDTERFNRRLVTIEGYVDRQSRIDGRHVEFDLVVEDRPVTVRLLVDSDPPQLEGTLLRATGVYAATHDPTGQPPRIEVWVARPQDLQVLGVLDADPRFKLAPTAIENLASAPAQQPVRIVGTVRAYHPGRLLTLRDETGQTLVHTAQSGPVQIGDRVEAIGIPEADGAEWVLRRGLFRRSQLPIGASELPSLRLTEQLRELRPEEAARGYPVQLSGVVTWAHKQADFFFLRDISGGIRVLKPADDNVDMVAGTRIDVTGISSAGKFTPVVLASHLRRYATMDLPEAKEITLEQALTGIEEGQWVSLSGYVRETGKSGPWARLELTTSGGDFTVLVPPSERLPNHRGAVVRVRGVCSAVANAKRQLVGVEIWVPSRHYIEVEEAAPADPFAVPAQSVASLRQFSVAQAANRRVRVSGVVLGQVPGRFVHLQEGLDALLVLSRSTLAVAPGDRIEAVGFPGRESSGVVLREAVYRRIGSGAQPAALNLGERPVIDDEIDGRLVRLEALLLDVAAHERGVRLIGQVNGLVFEALLDRLAAEVPDAWAAGSRVALTGVYNLQFDEFKRPHAIELRLRSAADVEVLAAPTWWTAERALTVTGVLAMGVLLGLAWVVALRRRVREQTAQIRVQFENEKAARVEAALARASKLESLGILAGGIAHDFNNLLTVVMCNLSLAKLGAQNDQETNRCLDEGVRAAGRARDLTQQLLTFAKGGAPVRASTLLPDVVRESAEFALHGAKARCDFDLAPDLWPADVDKGQIGQVVQNIVINANQAMPAGGVITIVLRNAEVAAGTVPALAAGRYLKLSISDRGSGIAPKDLPRIFDPYFTTKQHGSGLGLATVYSIVKQHQGHVEVASTVGVGTTFHIWLPAADQPPSPPAATPAAMPALRGRVLFMDDEPSIRMLATAVFKRMGLQAIVVNDGAEVVREFAVAMAAGRRFDVVILDLTVPGGMGGAEAMEKLRELDPNVRAIVSSGYSSDPVLANYRAYGFCGIVPKPYEAGDLAKAIDAVLRTEKVAEVSG